MDRVRICLSPRAWNVLEEDMSTFGVEKTLAGMINAVVSSSWETSEASISLARDRKERELARALQEMKYLDTYRNDTLLLHFDQKKESLSSVEADLVSRLADSHASSLLKKVRAFPRGESRVIRLRKDVREIVGVGDGASCPEGKHYSKTSEYIKALVEFYAEKPLFEREGIIFGDLIAGLQREVEAASGDRRVLLLTLKTPTRPKYEVKPYRIMSDKGMNYHYLVCLSRPCSDPFEPYRVASFRVSRIESFKPYAKSHGSGSLTKAQVKSVEAAIKEKGVQYLVGDPFSCKIRLTEAGYGKFQSILHLRPIAKSVERLSDGGCIAEFDCTEMQIEHYFFKFGKDAEVLEPRLLRERFCEMHRAAADLCG